jgi:type I restriction enzyme M protein
MPVLGLIFLRHATNRFEAVKKEIEATLPKRGGQTRPLTKEDFKGRRAIYLPEIARYSSLVALPENANVGGQINEAMEAIEQESVMLKGALPKEYARFEPRLLRDLLRIFNSEALKNATGDVFGRIYEYFLNKFAQTGAQEGGSFLPHPPWCGPSSTNWGRSKHHHY